MLTAGAPTRGLLGVSRREVVACPGSSAGGRWGLAVTSAALPMATLSAKDCARLPDRAFAYIGSRGQRRLPIHDAAHVRSALSRFGQVAFEDDAARDRARNRLLNAAKKHGIMPIGFVSAQLQPDKRLPAGQVTLLLADIEGANGMLQRLG